jgi:hypothetical protein
MNYTLIANTVVMVAAGLMFIFYPGFLVLSEDEYAHMMARSFGVACVSCGLLSGLLYTLTEYLHAKQLGFATLSLFHFGTFLVQLVAFLDGLIPVFIPLLHLLFAVMFVSYTVKYNK